MLVILIFVGGGQKYLDFFFGGGGGGGDGHTNLIVQFGLRGRGVYIPVWFWHWKTCDPGIPPCHILDIPTIFFGLITDPCMNPLYGIQYFIPLETITITKHKSFLTLFLDRFPLTGRGRVVDHTPLYETPYEFFSSFIFYNLAKLKNNCRFYAKGNSKKFKIEKIEVKWSSHWKSNFKKYHCKRKVHNSVKSLPLFFCKHHHFISIKRFCNK